MKKPIGAYADIEWNDSGLELAYFSFGTWTDDAETDSYGVDDDIIFGYTDGEKGLNAMRSGYVEGYNVVNYDLVYDKEDV